MNKVFKVIWNAASQSWVAVSELGKAKTKTKSVSLAAAGVALALSGMANAASVVNIGSDSEDAIVIVNGVTSETEVIKSGGNNGSAGKATATDYSGVYIGTEISAGLGDGDRSNQNGARNAGGTSSVIIGMNASSTESNSVVIGKNVSGGTANGVMQTATGTSDVGNVVIGYNTTALTGGSVAIGINSSALDNGGVAVGFNAISAGQDDLAIGYFAKADSGKTPANQSSTAVGSRSTATGWGSAALGTDANATGTMSTSLGIGSNATAQSTTAVGNSAKSTGFRATASGWNATATGTRATATGGNAQATGYYTTATGAESVAAASGAVANGAYAKALAQKTIAIGDNANATAVGAVSVGANSNATANYSTVLGFNATTTHANSVVIGANSYAIGSKAAEDTSIEIEGSDKDAYTYDSSKYAGYASSKNEGNYVSLGSEGNERQLKFVAAGDVSADSSDVVNGSQLFAVMERLENVAQSGWVVAGQEGNQNATRVGLDDQVNFNNGTLTVANVASSKAGNKHIADVTYNVVTQALATTSTNGKAAVSSDLPQAGGEAAGNAANPNALTTAQNVADAINSAFWTTKNTDGTTANVKPGSAVNFADGNGTTANVTTVGNTTTVKFDVKIADLTTPLSASSNGNITAPADANKLATAGDIATAINNSGWKVTTATTGTGARAAGTTASEELVKPGETVKFIAGDNLEIKQAGQNITYSTKQNVTFNKVESTTVVVGRGVNTTTLTSTANGLDVGGDKITNVANGTISATSTDAVNGSQLYAEAAKAKTEVKAGKNVTVTPSTATDGHTIYTVDAKGDLDEVKSINIQNGANSPAANITVATGPAGVDGKDGESKTRIVYETTDPVTGQPVTENVATLNDGIKLVGDKGTDGTDGKDATTVAQSLNNEINIKGGATGDLTDGNIGVVADPANKTLTVKLAKDVDLGKDGSITAGTVNVGGGKGADGKALPTTALTTKEGQNLAADGKSSLADGIKAAENALKAAEANLAALPATATDAEKAAAQAAVDAAKEAVTAAQTNAGKTADDKVDALSVGGNQITDVANGAINATSTDAVNGAQLYTVANAARTEVAAGKNVTVEKSTGAAGQDIYTVSATGDLDEVKSINIQNGANSPAANITVATGPAGVDGKDGESKTRIVYETTDPVTGQPVTENVATLNDGIKFQGNNPNVTTATKLNDVLVVKGDLAETAEASAQNVRVDVENGELVVKIAEKPTFEGVTIGGKETTTTDANGQTVTTTTPAATLTAVEGKDLKADGVTANEPARDVVALSVADKDGNPSQITNVANGAINAGSTDAINGGQLFEALKAKNVRVENGANTIVTSRVDADGATVYKVDTKGNVTDIDSIAINGKDGSTDAAGNNTSATTQVIQGPAGLDGNDGKDGVTKTRVEYVKANGDKETIATLNDGVKVAGDQGTTSTKLNDTLNIKGNSGSKELTDGNIGVVAGTDGLTVKLAKDVDLGTNGSLKAGGVTINSSGINAGGKKVTGVANGTISATSTDAINGSQLHAVANNINNRVNKLDKRVRGIGANSAAASSLPQVFTPGKSMLAAAAGGYGGASALAVGYSRASDNGKVILKVTGTANSEGHISGGVGVGFQW